MSSKSQAQNFLLFFLVAAGLICAVIWKNETGRPWLQLITVAPVWPVSCDGCTWFRSFRPETTLEQPWTVSSVVWSSDGRFLVVGSGFEGMFNVYYADNLALVSTIQRLDMGGTNSRVRFTEHDTSLISPRIMNRYAGAWAPTNDDSVSLEKWDIKRGLVSQEYYAHFQDESNHSVAWRRAASIAVAVTVSSDGELIAAGVQGPPSGVFIYNASSAHVLQNITCAPRNVPDVLAFSPDTKSIAVGGCNYHEVSVYDTKTGVLKYQRMVDPESQIYSAISYSPDGSLIAVASSGAEHGVVTILQAASGAALGVMPNTPPPLFSMSGERANITNLQWIDNNLILASYDFWNPDGSVARIWDVRSLKLAGGFRGNYLNIVAISPNGSRLAAVFGKNVVVGNLK